jgi:hypothetical protein
MTAEDQIRAGIIDELKRQAEIAPAELKVEVGANDQLIIHGSVNVDELVMVIMGSVAGGP